MQIDKSRPMDGTAGTFILHLNFLLFGERAIRKTRSINVIRATNGRLIIDDVMSAGTAARESIALIQAAGATPHAVAIALDRQEKATENGKDVDHSAVQYVRNQLGLQVCAIANLSDLLAYLEARGGEGEMAQHHERVLAYRQRYGVND